MSSIDLPPVRRQLLALKGIAFDHYTTERQKSLLS